MDNHEIQGIHLPQLLHTWAERSGKIPKRVRTRCRLIAATASVMEQSGYEGLTVDAIANHAGVARGTFYLYFSDRSDAATAVMRAFSAMMRRYRPRGGSQLTPMASIYRINLFYILSYANNSSLLAGRESLMRDRPELIRYRDAINTHWTRLILKDLCRRFNIPPERCEAPQTHLAVRAAIAMADEFLREIYVYESPGIVKLAQDPRDVALVLTQVWHRAIFGHDPAEWNPAHGLPMLLQTASASQNTPSCA
ncbi:MAG TPA: helix-turn-helix domain-containing protein [Burkholderiaceae bacterium]|nr:helix-turn-helix domain-containing protein [Burkholderiaceae bacterium]